MDCLFLQVAQLDMHPCKRNPLPFIHFAWRLSDSESGITESSKSNGVPPSWRTVFTIPSNQSRLFMKAEQIAEIEIPILESISSGQFDEFVPVTPEYEDMPFAVRIRLSNTELVTPEEDYLPPLERLRNLRTEYFGSTEP